jgi:hypothetical protein
MSLVREHLGNQVVTANRWMPRSSGCAKHSPRCRPWAASVTSALAGLDGEGAARSRPDVRREGSAGQGREAVPRNPRSVHPHHRRLGPELRRGRPRRIQAVSEATSVTTDFANLLLDSMTKKLLQDYAEVGMGGLDQLVTMVGHQRLQNAEPGPPGLPA